MKELIPYLRWWRSTTIRGREIVDACVAPTNLGTPEFQAALDGWKGTAYWTPEDGPGRLMLVRAVDPPQRERWWLHLTLFVVTFATVWMGGALLAITPLREGIPSIPTILSMILQDPTVMRPGLDFALGLMAILLAHETGHYILARRYNVNASPPYFLPAPPPINFVGTFGAFIRLRSPIVDRRQLFDIGAAGPWAGFVIAVAALVVGLSGSTVIPDAGMTAQFVALGDIQLYLGDSVLMRALRGALVGDGTVVMTPLAFAGWLGVFVTMINLLPLGQLDGGHVMYSLVGDRQRLIAPLVWVGLIGLGYFMPGRWGILGLPGQWWWWAWAVIILFLGRGRLSHPQVLDRHRPLPKGRRPLALVTILLFVITFTPAPIQ